MFTRRQLMASTVRRIRCDGHSAYGCRTPGVCSSVQYWKVRAPGSNGASISLRHHARRLCHMPKVVRHPRSEQLAEGDSTKLRVLALERQFAIGETPVAERRHIVRSQSRELVLRFDERLPLTLADRCEAIVRRKATVGISGEDDSGAWNPVRALAVDEVPDGRPAACARARQCPRTDRNSLFAARGCPRAALVDCSPLVSTRHRQPPAHRGDVSALRDRCRPSLSRDDRRPG